MTVMTNKRYVMQNAIIFTNYFLYIGELLRIFFFQLSHHGLSYESKTVEEGSLRFGEVGENLNERSDKWLFMKKMMSSEKIILKTRRRRKTRELEDQQQLNQQNSNNAQTGSIRFCSDCNTTKTPLWRSGPQGPKVLSSLFFNIFLCP